MVRSNRLKIVFTLVFFLGVCVFSQEKQVDDYKDKKLREEILAVYQSKGEQGLRDFVKKRKDKIASKFIIDFTKAGVKERKEEWIRVCDFMALEKKDEKTLADVYLIIGGYFSLNSDNKKAIDYYEKSLSLYVKLKDLDGQGNALLRKGRVYSLIGENSLGFQMCDRALPFLKKKGDFSGQGNVYLIKGVIYSNIGNTSSAIESYDKAMTSFEKADDLIGQGNVYKDKGKIYMYACDYAKAMEMYDKALTLFKKVNEPMGQGNIYLNKGLICTYTGNFYGALEMYDKAFPFFKNTGNIIGQGNVYRFKGDIYFYMKGPNRSIDMYEKAIKLFKKANDPIGLGNVYKKKGDIYFFNGDNKHAFEMYDRALPFFEKIGEPMGIGYINRSKGDIYLIKGEYPKAEEFYDMALYFFEKAKDATGKGSVYGSKGKLFLIIGDNFNALKMLSKALNIFKKAKDPIGQALIYMNIGDIYFRVGDISKAQAKYDNALLLFEKTNHLSGKANVYHGKGNFCYNKGKYTEAIELFQKALTLHKKSNDPLGQGNVYFSKGEILSKEGNYKKAMDMYDKALSFYKKVGELVSQGNVCLMKGNLHFRNKDYPKALNEYNLAQSIFEKIEEIVGLSFTLHGKAKILSKQEKKDEALNLFEKAITNLEIMRSQTPLSEMKQFFMEMSYNQYEETVLFMLENKYYDKGFRYAESIKARVFLDRMGEGLVPLEKGLKPQLRKERDKLIAKISNISKEMHETDVEKEKKMAELKEKSRKMEYEFEDLLIKIRQENPLYASVRYPQPISVQSLQKDVLKKGEILVRYFITSDKAYVFLVSKKRFKVLPLEVKEEKIKSYVNRWLLAVKDNKTGDMEMYGKLLYRGLIKPIEIKLKGSRDIIIIPDSHLEKIPFESFIMGEKKSGRPLFLLEKYRIKYIQSSSILSILRKHYRRDRETKNFIAFGDPVYDYKNFTQNKPEYGSLTLSPEENDEIRQVLRGRYDRAGGTWKRLFHSGEEVKTIARLFEKKSQKCTVHLREQATEENAKAADIKNFDYIHLACHGLLNDDFQSLVLSQLPSDKSREDGYFTLNEIMNCDYHAKLVVLSACHTGSGKMERAEGVTGLTRAVMYAGTPAVVASLWKVDDNATKYLMVKFYENILEKNLDKVEALRQAKLELIKNKNYSSPLLWSAFVMYGE